ncbi:hypothetical protein SMD44_04314 [Streptomyces alboflavus]|uniref:Uncharacterized protein n=1 Tax=Streptomyces alboflavus TaxID=67267 RepID=A0A1Z1WEM8_9ACTN|nr:hypothetical protein SMD44_04314 [Streptomyces alboflavus]
MVPSGSGGGVWAQTRGSGWYCADGGWA